MRWPRSLTARILLAEVSAIAVVIVVLPALAISLLHQTMADFQASALTAQARQVATGVDERRGAPVVRLPPSLAAAYRTAYDGRGFALLDARGRIVVASDGALALPGGKVPLHAGAIRFDLPPLTGVVLPVPGRLRLWVAVIQDQAEPGAILDDVVDAFLWQFVAVLVAVLTLLPLVNSLLIRRVVMAVLRVSHRAAAIGADNLEVRLDEADVPTEVVELVHATNDLLARLQHSFAAQHAFIGNVVHELRTPLAALKIQLDGIADDRARAALHQSLDRVSHVVSQVRDLARLETLDAGSRHDFDLRDVARDAIAELAPEIYAAGDRVDLAVPDSAVMVTGEPTLARLALGNLLSNATRHSPSGILITVEVTTDGTARISDTGPGIVSESRGLVARRFWRADQRRSDGAGLGLSIVQRIMAVHGGSFQITSDAGHGATFQLAFPLAS